MDENIFEEWDKNIKSILSKQEAFEKSDAETKEKIRQMEIKAGRLKGGGGSHEISMNTVIENKLNENKDNIAKLIRKDIKDMSFELDTKAVGAMDFSTNFSTADVMVANLRPGIITPPPRPFHIRQALPFGTMSGSNYIFVRETGSQGGPSVTPSGSIKPQIDFSFEEVSTSAKVIAVWLQITNTLLEDIPSMTNLISGRLMEKLYTAEDAELLNGTGTDHFSGINTAGNYTAGTSTATVPVERLIAGIGQLATLGRTASAILLSPDDYYSLQVNKADTSGVYDLPKGVSVGPDGGLRVLGVPTYWIADQPSGTYTIGAFEQGTILLQRWAPRIELFVDSTLAKINSVMIRAEFREAFAIFGNSYIVKGSLS